MAMVQKSKRLVSLVKDLKRSRDTWCIEVRIILLWGTKIHASVESSLIKKYENDLAEGQAKGVHLFKVNDVGGDYRTSTHCFKINFFQTTVLGVINRFKINFFQTTYKSFQLFVFYYHINSDELED
ncbi:hypothetical protein N665_1157s0001 [Sinapis alba]|nr:hypothetical protein N665_1157s0001 [Sinapis alba]